MAKELDLNKNELTESEVNLLMRRINSKKIKPNEVPHIADGEGYRLTSSQIAKGKSFLMGLWKTPTGKEKENSPFGYREQRALETLKTIKLRDVYSERGNYYVPLYAVEGEEGYFEYYYSGGKISIVG